MSNEPQDDFAAIAKPLPTGKKTAAAPEADDFAAISHPIEFTQNDANEGTYEMAAPHGDKIKIPYSKIGDAGKAGYKMTDADRTRYVKDSANDPNLKNETAPEGSKIVGKNSAGQNILASDSGINGTTLDNFANSEYAAIGGAAKGLVKLFDPRPTEQEKKRAETTGPVASTFDILMRVPERMIQPNVDMGIQAENELAAGRQSNEKGMNRTANFTSAAEHGIAAAIPLVGPFAANVIDQTGELIANRNYGGAAGNIVGNAVVAEAPGVVGEAAKKGLKAIPRTAGSFVENISRTSPREVKNLAEHTEQANTELAKKADEANSKNTERHLGETLDAVQEANKHANKEGFRNEELDRKNEQDRQEFNKKELERVKKEGEARLEALKNNKDKITDYEERRERIKKENDANYRREIRQQNLQSKLKSSTEKADTLYQKAYKDAKTAYNATWNKWRDMMNKANAKADMNSTVDTIAQQTRSMNPEKVPIFMDILRETSPDVPTAANTPASAFDNLAHANLADMVANKMLKGGYKQALHGEIEEGLEVPVLAGFHEIAAKTGADLADAKSSLKASSPLLEVPAERLHGWKSQLERAVREAKDPTVRHALGEVLKQVRKTEEDVTASVGPDAVKQLAKARSITGPYFDAFVKSPEDLPRAAGQSLRELNPEYVKEKAAEQRLDRIAKYNPDFAAATRRVANIKEGLEGIKKEKDIGKRSELPLRPDLKDVPTVTPAGEFQAKPFEAKPGPKGAVVPDRPPTEVPDLKSLSKEDLEKWKKENVAKTAQRIRDLSLSRAMYAGMTGIPVSIASFFMGHPGAAALELATPGAVIGFSSAVANLLEKPGVVEFLSRVTDKDIEAFNNLPPKQKALFKDDMGVLAEEAKKNGAMISPVLSMFIASPTVAPRKKKPTPKELLEQAHSNLQSSLYSSGLGDITPPKYAHTAVHDESGHQIGSHDGKKWFDVMSGTQV